MKDSEKIFYTIARLLWQLFVSPFFLMKIYGWIIIPLFSVTHLITYHECIAFCILVGYVNYFTKKPVRDYKDEYYAKDFYHSVFGGSLFLLFSWSIHFFI